MKIGPLEFSEELLASHAEGRLVLFVGAGISVDQPSNLPLFDGLADQVAPGRQEQEPPDKFLSRVQDNRGLPVHKRVANILTRATAKPNRLHRAIAALFPHADSVRIVSTNFDLLLEEPLQETFDSNVEIFTSPALPSGTDFSGLVYLHGSARRPDDMIVTDRDFGRAYLGNEERARSFLLSLYQSYDVLFIGYSHDDTVMQYLVRGLSPTVQRKRYAISPSGRSQHWHELGVAVIEYSDERDHAELTHGLEEWAKRISWGYRDHQERIRSLVEDSPEALKTEDDVFLQAVFNDESLQLYFTQYAVDASWLEWAHHHGLIASILGCESTPSSDLAYWFAARPFGHRGEFAISILVELDETATLSMEVWSAVAMTIYRSLAEDESILDTTATRRRFGLWLGLLKEHQRRGINVGPMWMWLEHIPKRHHDQLLATLEFLIEPLFAGNSHPLYPDEDGSRVMVDVRYRGRDDLTNYLRGSISEIQAKFAEPLLELLGHQLESAHRLYRVCGSGDTSIDPLIPYRASIEPSERNHPQFGDPIEMVVDLARDALDVLTEKLPRISRMFVDRWIRSSAPVLRRLALYAAVSHPRMTANQKIELVLQREHLIDSRIRYEVFALLKAAYPHLSEPSRRRLLRRKQRALGVHYEVRDESRREEFTRWREQEWFTFLSWLRTAESSCPLLVQALDSVKEAYPDFVQEEQPEYRGAIRIGRYHFETPIEAPELLTLGPHETLSRYRSYRSTSGSGRRDLLPGFLSAVEEAAAQSISWSIALADQLLTGSGGERLWSTIFSCWCTSMSSNSSDEEMLGEVWTFLSRPSVLEAHSDRIPGLLTKRLRVESVAHSAASIEQHAALGLSALPHIDYERLCLPDEQQSYSQAINHPAGDVAEFALNALSVIHNLDPRESLASCPIVGHLLEALVSTSSAERWQGRVVLARHLNFLFEVEPDWTREHLLPLLSWRPDAARASTSVVELSRLC